MKTRFIETENRQTGARPALQKAPQMEDYPASWQQQGVWLQTLLDPDKSLWNTSHSWRFGGPLDLGAFQEALGNLVGRQASLRTFFILRGEEIIQQVLPENALSPETYFTLVDISHLPEGEREASARALQEEEAKKGYDLSRLPLIRFALIRLAQEDHVLVMSKHHIISDVASRQILWRELVGFYNAHAGGRSGFSPRLEIEYTDYAWWQREFMKSPAYRGQKNFWLAQFPGPDEEPIPLLPLIADFSPGRGPGRSGRSASYLVEVSPELTAQLRTFSLRQRAAFSSLFLAAYTILLYKYTDRTDMIVGSMYRGRQADKKALDEVVGLFANSIAQPFHLSPKTRLDEWLRQVDEKVRQAYQNQDFLYEDLVRTLHPQRTAHRAEIFNVVFNMLKVTAMDIDPAGLVRKEWLGPDLESDISSQYDLSLFVRDEIKKLSLRFLFPGDKFRPGTMARMMNHYMAILEGISREREMTIDGIDIVSAEERRTLVVDFNATDRPFPGDKTIDMLFAEQVARTPHNLALVGGCLETGEMVQLSYSEVGRLVVLLAGRLLAGGVGPNGLVGVRLARSVDMIIALLGILTAGGAYLPIDPAYPEERIEYMLADSGAEIVIGQHGVGANCRSPIQDIGAECKGERQLAPTCLAYIIYTSGSTGRPKGVAIGHYSLVNRLHWMQRQYPLGPADRILHKTPFTFDVSVWEIFWWALAGASVSTLAPAGEKDPEQIIEAVSRSRATVMHFVPTMLSQFLDYVKEGGRGAVWRLASLKQVFASGEALSVSHVETFFDLLGANGTRLANLYGPTEATVDVSYFDCLPGAQLGAIPIGRPIDNIGLYILDGKLRLQPLGVPGELCIRGVGLARGYLNKPELTAERFVTSPLASTKLGGGYNGGRELAQRPSVSRLSKRGEGENAAERGAAAIPGTCMLNRIAESPQFVKPQAKLSTVLAGSEGDWCVSPAPNPSPFTSRLYRTGDLARWLPDGNIEFLGRLDFQVKIRGFRIELQEIEAALLKHPAIREAVVIVIEPANQGKYLCAYLVARSDSRKPGDSGEIPGLMPDQLRDFLARGLPDYMIPAQFVRLEHLPLTTSGKVDKKSLPLPDIAASVRARSAYEAPVNEVQTALVSVWQEVLGVQPIGIDDHFLASGGDSIKAIVVASRLAGRGYRFDIPLIFHYPTIRELSAFVAPVTGESGPQSVAASARDIDPAELDQLAGLFDPGNVTAIYPLTPMQSGMLFHYLLDSRRQAYQMQLTFTLEGLVDPDLLETCCRLLLARHPALRTAFVYKDTRQPRQVFLAGRRSVYAFYDLTDGGQPAMTLEEIQQQDRQRGFDLATDTLIRFTLVRTGSGRYALLVTHHHLILDGWSINRLLKDLISLYESGKNGSSQSLGNEYPFQDYLAWLSRQDSGAAGRYFRDYLAGFDGLTRISAPGRQPEPGDAAFVKGTYSITLDTRLKQALASRANDLEVTLNTIFQAAWVILLHRYAGSDDVVFGSVISGRNIPVAGVEKMVGLFINTIPMRVILSAKEPFDRFCQRLMSNQFDTHAHGAISLGDIQEHTQRSGQLFEHLYLYENYPLEAEVRSRELIDRLGFCITGRQSSEHTNYHLNLVILPREEIIVRFQYNERVYSLDFVACLAGQLVGLIEQAAGERSKMIGAFDLLPARQRQQIVDEFNRTGAPLPLDKTVIDLFAAQVEKNADCTAILGLLVPGMRVGEWGHLTYLELARLVGEMAVGLRARGVGPGLMVAIMLGRSIDMLVGILAVLAAGGAYLPVDPAYPRDRVEYMLADSGIEIVLASLRPPESPPGGGERLFSLPVHGEGPGWGTPTDLAYVIYTSGSTGRPKGVAITHGNMVNFIVGIGAKIDFRPGDRILSLTTISFDIFGLETLVPLARGVTVIMGSEAEQGDPAAALRLFSREQITLFQATPSRLQLFLAHDGAGTAGCVSSLRYVLLGGEALPQKLLDQVRAILTGRPGKIINLYGPTETTIWSTACELDAGALLTIGRPLANTQVFILDKRAGLCPVGVAGELVIGGLGLARGYLNNPELTAERFVTSPPGPLSKRGEGEDKGGQHLSRPPSGVEGPDEQNPTPVSRLYKTGDLARWLPDGQIEFLGRIDTQVKIRGFRVELGEIETCLTRHPGIQEAVVIDLTGEDGEKSLCAYLVGRQDLALEDIQDHIRQKLPDYMVPSYFVRLDKFPLTPSGKVDRKALPGPRDGLYLAGRTAYVAPGNPMQEGLQEIWQDILKREPVGIHDNFFVLGGHSLRVMDMAARIYRAFGIELALADIFNDPTIVGVARLIEAEQDKQKKIEAILQEIEARG